MRSGRGLSGFWAGMRHPWIAPYLLFYGCGVALLGGLGRGEALRDVLSAFAVAGVGLLITAGAVWYEGSRPGSAPRPWLGVLLVVGVTVLGIVRPAFTSLPFVLEPTRVLLSHLLWQAVVPAVVLLLSGVPWRTLGLATLIRAWGRWRRLVLLLMAALTLPVLLYPGVAAAWVNHTIGECLLALLVAYAYAWLAQALPMEFLFRQVLQPRLQALLRLPTAAVVVQALLFGLAGAGRWLARGEPWPLALLAALLEGSPLGIFYGLLRDRTGSLALSVFVHAYVAGWAHLPMALALI